MTLYGRLAPTDPAGLISAQVVLVDMASGQTTQGALQSDGRFMFARLRPGAIYYIAAWLRLRNVASMGSSGSDPQYSWHQVVQAGQPGTFSVDLSHANADSEFISDVLPVSAIREPGSGRRAQLTPLNGG